jgi:hypothetical protein
MSAYSDSVSEPVFFEPDSVSAKKNIETEVEIGFFRPFSSLAAGGSSRHLRTGSPLIKNAKWVLAWWCGTTVMY